MKADLMYHALDVLSLFKSVDRNTFIDVLFFDRKHENYEEFMWTAFTNDYFAFLTTLNRQEFLIVHEYCMERWEEAEDNKRDV